MNPTCYKVFAIKVILSDDSRPQYVTRVYNGHYRFSPDYSDAKLFRWSTARNHIAAIRATMTAPARQ